MIKNCIITVLLALLNAPFAYADYSDVQYDVYEYPGGGMRVFYPARSVKYMEETGIMTGYSDGTFRPKNHINRAEFMKILVEASEEALDVEGYANCFPDVTDQWFAKYICYAASEGWIDGYPDGLFHPERNVVRSEAIKMIVMSRSYYVHPPVDRGYPVDAWYAPYVETLYQQHILHEAVLGGEEGDKEAILALALTRSEVASFMYKVHLNEGLVSITFTPDGTCTGDAIKTATSYVSSMVAWIVDDGEETCMLEEYFNPFSYISNHDIGTRIVGVGAEKSGKNTYVPLQDGKARFRVTNRGREFKEYTNDAGDWEFDLSTLTLRQLPRKS